MPVGGQQRSTDNWTSPPCFSFWRSPNYGCRKYIKLGRAPYQGIISQPMSVCWGPDLQPTAFSTSPPHWTTYTPLVWYWPSISPPTPVHIVSFPSCLAIPCFQSFRTKTLGLSLIPFSLTPHIQTLTIICWLCLHNTPRSYSLLTTSIANTLVQATIISNLDNYRSLLAFLFHPWPGLTVINLVTLWNPRENNVSLLSKLSTGSSSSWVKVSPSNDLPGSTACSPSGICYSYLPHPSTLIAMPSLFFILATKPAQHCSGSRLVTSVPSSVLIQCLLRFQKSSPHLLEKG